MTEEYEMDIKRRVIEVDFDTALVKQFIALGGVVERDGDHFGAVIGDLPTGCSGFKKTRSEAISECMHNWYNEKAVKPLMDR